MYPQIKSNNKYNAKKSTYNGMKFDSKGEAGYCEQLDWRIKAGEIQGYERQVKIPLEVNGVLIFNYIADFVVTGKHGEKEIHEYKGLRLPLFDAKWKLLQALLVEPSDTIKELFPEGAELVMIQHVGQKRKLWKK